jgi:hypothetical protein
MTLTEEQRGRLRVALAPLLPRLRNASPPERAKLLREALEWAGVAPTWAEWEAYADELLGEGAPHDPPEHNRGGQSPH